MKKLLVGFVAILMSASGICQTMAVKAVKESADLLTSEWLTSFTEVRVDGDMQIEFIKIPDTEAPKIVYDRKGNYTSKFSAAVSKGVLIITEKVDSKRPSKTEVKIYYNTLAVVSIAKATVTFVDTLDYGMMDVTVSGGAYVKAKFDVKDLKLDITGKSRADFTGDVRYLTLNVSTAKFDAPNLDVMSAMVDASHNAALFLNISERLVAKASTGAKITYDGKPQLVRSASTMFGGEINPVQ